VLGPLGESSYAVSLDMVSSLSRNLSRRRRRRGGHFLALSLSLAAVVLLGSIAVAQGADGDKPALPASAPIPKTISTAGDASPSAVSSSTPPPYADAAECSAGTGRELLVALATPACRVITLEGVVSVYDADFAGIDRGAPATRLDRDGGFVRASPVVLRSARGAGVGVATRNGTRAASRGSSSSSSSSALEAATRLTLHVDVPKGVAVELSGLSLAGISAKAPAANARADATVGGRAAVADGGAMFSIFHVHAGGEVKLTGCDLRAKRGMCSAEAAPAAAAAAAAAEAPAPPLGGGGGGADPSVGRRVDSALLLAADPSAAFRRAEDGDVVIERAAMDPLALFGSVQRPSSSSAPPAAAAAAAMAAAPAPAGPRRSPLRRRLLSSSHPAAPSSSSSASSSASSSFARLVIVDTVLWCPETGFVRAGKPSSPGEGRAAAAVASRVWTPLELSAALGSAGSRTVLCEDDLVLPRAGHGRPAALVQDRDVVFRAAAGAGAGAGAAAPAGGGSPPPPRRRPVRLSCLHEPGARDCVFPVVAAGSGGSVSFEGLAIEAPDPGCAVKPATRCSYRGRELPGALRGSLTPAGAVGVSAGGWLVFSDVELSYDFCTPEFERAAAAVAEAAASGGAGAAADGVTLVRASSGAAAAAAAAAGGHLAAPRVAFSCAHCDFECSVPGSVERGELPATFSLRNTTISCSRPLPASLRKRAGTGVVRAGGGGEDPGEGALASSSSSSSSSSHASIRLSTSALAATIAAGGAAVAAAALGAALGARTVARRAAAAEAAAAVAGSLGAGSTSDDDGDDERVRVASSSSSSPASFASTDAVLPSSQQQQQQQRPWWRRVFVPPSSDGPNATSAAATS